MFNCYNNSMENTYLFILWNKALFCKDKILNNLNNDFEIIKTLYIKWDNNNFCKNLQSLYGHKLGSPIEKIIPCGKDVFLFVLIKDNNAVYETKKLYDGEEIINLNIYNKKQLYREWTLGSNRIHCSDSIEETLHDLVVLFGKDYEDVLSKYKNDDIVALDTKTIVGFNDFDDFEQCLKLFGKNKLIRRDNISFIFCKSRRDIEYFLSDTYIKSNNIKVYGELEGDLPDNSFELIKKDDYISETIIDNCVSYDSYLSNRVKLPSDVASVFKKYNLDTSFNKKETDRKTNPSIYINILKNEIKYMIGKHK